MFYSIPSSKNYFITFLRFHGFFFNKYPQMRRNSDHVTVLKPCISTTCMMIPLQKAEWAMETRPLSVTLVSSMLNVVNVEMFGEFIIASISASVKLTHHAKSSSTMPLQKADWARANKVPSVTFAVDVVLLSWWSSLSLLKLSCQRQWNSSILSTSNRLWFYNKLSERQPWSCCS